MTISLAANVALIGLVGYGYWFIQNLSRPQKIEVPPRVVTNTITQIAVRKVNPSNFWAALAASRTPNWTLVESTNYVQYIENLRTIGCPEETIRDIIIADVAKLYAKRRAAVRAQAKPDPFWKSADMNNTPEKQSIQQQLDALDQDERALIKQLLGVDLDAELAKYNPEDEGEATAFAYLPEEKRAPLAELQKHFEQAEEAVYREAKGLVLEEDEERIRKLELQKEAELAKFLTPQELEEYQVRTSTTANNLRDQLADFGASEEEFRQIFRLQKAFDDQFDRGFDFTDEKQMELRNQAQPAAEQALKDEFKKVLGEKRYAEYQRAQDPDYRALTQFSERFDLSPDTIAKVYDMKQEAQRQRAILEANLNLAPERRQAALEALVKITQRSISETLGGPQSKAWGAYRKNAGQWLEDLKISDVPEPEPAPEPVENMALPPPFFPPIPIVPPR